MIRTRDTDSFAHAHKGLRKGLIENCSDPTLLAGLLAASEPAAEPTPCVFYTPPEGKRQIDYPERRSFGFGKEVLVSVARAAWGVARQNRTTHIPRTQEAMHSCGTIGDNATGSGCCVNPNHIYPGNRKQGETR